MTWHACIVAVALAQAQPSAPIRFTDATAGSGLDATMTSGAMPSTAILEVKGGGLALIDFDGDGDPDVFMPNGATLADPEHGPGARLFENLGGLRFRDATGRMGVRHTRWSFGCAVGDYDGDGRDDLYVCCHGPDVLLRNMGDGRFEDVTAKAGLGDPAWSTGAAFADLDGDGDLDLFVVNYVDFDPANPPAPASFKGIPVLAGPRGLPAHVDLLYENRGDGTFRDASQSAGIRAAIPGYGLNLAILDFDGDARLRSGIGTNLDGAAQATMGIAIGDVDGDARPDVHTTVFSSDTNTLHVNLDGRFFDDRTARYGVGAPSRPLLGWATAFIDLEHDGDEDLVVFNGHVYPQATRATMDSDYAQPPLVLRRDGARFAVEASPGPGLQGAHRDRTAVFADLDGDGDQDIVVGELNGPLRLLRNDHDRADDWIEVRLVNAARGDLHGVGARVRLVDSSGTTRATRWMWGGGPFQSNVAPVLHVGAPAAWGPLMLEIDWPWGGTQRAGEISRGRVTDVRRDPAITGAATPGSRSAP
jgi:hypothetical protein